MRHVLPGVCILITVLACTVFAQTDSSAGDENGWKVSINSNLTLTMNMYSDNWTGGELSAFSWAAQFNGVFEKQLFEKLNNRNTLKLAFGQTMLQQEDSTGDKKWLDPEKSTDLIDFESLFRFTLNSFVDPFFGVRFVSQFYDASDPDNTLAVNPIAITESFGAARSLVKKDNITWDARLAGAVRQTIERHKADVDSAFTNDGGLEFVTELFTVNKAKWLEFSSILKVYEALFSTKSDDMQDFPQQWQHPDINWENSLTVNLTKYIMLNVYLQLLYDKEIDSDPRFKETLSLGLTYTFKNH